MESDISAKFCEYILIRHKQELLEILKNPDESQNFSLVVNFITLFEDDIDLGNGLLTEPEKYLLLFNKATNVAQKYLSEELEKENSNNQFNVKSKVFVRITALPVFGEKHYPSNDDLGSFVKINGAIVKVGAPKLLEYQRDYTCGKCHHVVTITASYEKYYSISSPSKCSECNSTSIAPQKKPNMCCFKDYQEIKVQEHFGKSKVGTVPNTIWVTLEDDLVDMCKPGDDVVVTGIVMRRWKPLRPDAKYDIDLVLKANNLEVCNEQKSTVGNNEARENFSKFWDYYKHQELIGRNHILRSFCPQIFGLYLAKLAMITVLAGGVQKSDENGCSARGMSHLLLVGDAGTGKSHLLRYASKISGRSVFTTGVGSTNAGLTVSAVRESGDWSLEAGALVLADGGVCCIDDFNSIREHDRTSIHEAMEQQSISVAKAGIVTKLHTRCSIFATTAPKGKYDRSVSMNVNVAISSPLLSRFDIVLLLLDSKNSSWDKSLCSFIFKGGKNDGISQEPFHLSTKGETLVTDIWTTATLQSYFSIIKQINPVVTPDAGIILRTYYQNQRMADTRNAARTTVRLLESLIRLSQGHARLMFRDEVTVLDAIVAISLIESSMHNTTLMSETNALHTVFPIDPYAEYLSQLELILTKLNLKEIFDREVQNIKKTEMAAINLEHWQEKGNGKKENNTDLSRASSQSTSGEFLTEKAPKMFAQINGFDAETVKGNSEDGMPSPSIVSPILHRNENVRKNLGVSVKKNKKTRNERSPSVEPVPNDTTIEDNTVHESQPAKRVKLSKGESSVVDASPSFQINLKLKTKEKLKKFRSVQTSKAESPKSDVETSFTEKGLNDSSASSSKEVSSLMLNSSSDETPKKPQNSFTLTEQDWNDLDIF